ncbi:MAG: prepilin-type N-terminal cleavage/methylation domain-containing protein [Candidatus Omnitrophota bacterium]|nr:prepilin-type N-terminal cleavage/methylation domain-containing protein [Candidatus Omnitrophota bacterium]
MANIRIKNKRAFTLVELIIVTVLSAVLFFGAGQLIFSHAKFSTTLQAGMALTQELIAITESIAANVRNSSYVEIGTNTLALHGPAAGDYAWSVPENENKLYYKSQLVSDKLDPTTPPVFTEVTAVNGKTKAISINVKVKDPRYPDASKSMTTTAFCRVTASGDLVRVVTDGGTEVGKYSTIQAGVNAALDGYTVQVSYNNKTPYNESVSLGSKNITVRGAYDNTDWDYGSHIGKADEAAYETIIDGTGLSGNLVEIINPILFGDGTVIDGFTIRNNPAGPAISAEGKLITISNNLITNNNNSSGACPTAVMLRTSGSSTNLYITRNTITSNAGGTGGIGFRHQPFESTSGNTYIYNNIITDNTDSGLWLNESLFSAYISIANNDISRNGKSNDVGGGIRAYLTCNGSDKALLDISNNTIIGNTALDGVGIFVSFTKSAPGNSNYGLLCTYNEINANVISNSSHDGSAISFMGVNAYSGIRQNTIQENSGGKTVVYINHSDSGWGGGGYGGAANNSIRDNNSGCPLYAIVNSRCTTWGTWDVVCNIVTNNTVENGCAGIHVELATDDTASVRVWSNLITENRVTGPGLGSGLDIHYLPLTANNAIIDTSANVIARNNGQDFAGIYFRSDDAKNSGKATVRGTITFGNTSTVVGNPDSGGEYKPSYGYYNGDYNSSRYIDIIDSYTFGYKGPQTAGNIDTVDYPDPLFVGGNPYNYHLQPASPCRYPVPPYQMGCYWQGDIIGPLPSTDNSFTPYVREDIIGRY